jgi:predicted acylesterase/phospholipase RssA
MGIVNGLMFKSGIYNNEPLLNLLTSAFKSLGSVKRKLVVASVDANTGRYVTFDETQPIEKLAFYTVASASIPFIFPHRNDGANVLVDASVVWNTNLGSAIEKCLEIVDDPSQIIMDIIICNSPKMSNPANTSNSIDNYMRIRSIKSYYKDLNDVFEI